MSENIVTNSLSEGVIKSENPESHTDNDMYVYVETDIKPEPSDLEQSSSMITIIGEPIDPTPLSKSPPPYERCDFCFKMLQPQTRVHFDANGQFCLEKKIEFVLATDLDLSANTPRCCAHCWHMFELFASFKRSCLVALGKQEEVRAFEIPCGTAQTEVHVVASDSPAKKAQPKAKPQPKQPEKIPKPIPAGSSTTRFSCDTCPRSFGSLNGLNIHRPQCKRVEKFRCKLCPAAFTRPLNLQNHLNWHNNLKPYRCRLNNCIAKFNSEARRKNHEKEVLKDPNSRCTICHKKVRVGSCMKRHIRRYHKERNQQIDFDQVMEENTSDTNGSEA